MNCLTLIDLVVCVQPIRRIPGFPLLPGSPADRAFKAMAGMLSPDAVENGGKRMPYVKRFTT